MIANGGDTAISPDNIDTSGDQLMINEDGTFSSRPVMASKGRDGSIWRFDLVASGNGQTADAASGKRIAELDPPGRDGVPVGPGVWETSGIINLGGMFGGNFWLFDVQAHPPTTAPAPGTVEDGQLLLMRRVQATTADGFTPRTGGLSHDPGLRSARRYEIHQIAHAPSQNACVAARVRLGLAGATGFPAAAVAAAGAVAAQYWYVAHRPLPSFHELDANGVFGPQTMPEARVVLLGDSTVTGPGLESPSDLWSHQVGRRLALEHRVRLLSLAAGGSRARDVLARQLPEALKLEPHLAVVSVGANDATHCTPLRKVEGELDAIAAAFDDIGTGVVLAGLGDLGNIPRLRFPLKALASRRSRAIDRIHARVATRHGHVVKVPIAQQCDKFFRSVDVFCPDLFHPNRAGHAAWADAAYPVIADAFRRCVSQRR